MRSGEPQDPIRLIGNNLTAPEDVDTLLRGVKLGRAILAAPSMQALGFSELSPGDIPDAEMVSYIRSLAKTVYHPAGTCRMGSDPLAVVDDQLRVKGIPRLRVADASIMPTLVSGNTNAPCIMIAERCADFILAA